MKDIIEQLVQQELDELIKQTAERIMREFIIELIKNNPRTLGKLNTENNMNDENKPTIQELENQLIDLQKKISEEKEKEQLKNQQDNFKVGDYVICIRNDATELECGFIYQIESFSKYPDNGNISWICLLGLNQYDLGFYRNRFRPANSDEIIQELNKISEGEYVVCINSSDSDLKNNTVYKVEGFRLGNSSSYFKIKGIEWMISRFRKALPSEVEQFTKSELGNFIAGDYVTALDTCFGFITGKIYIVDNIDCNYINVLKDEDGRENGWHKSHFRRSTQDEIEQYKREKIKAERKKLIDDIKVGDYVKITSYISDYFNVGGVYKVLDIIEDHHSNYYKLDEVRGESRGVYFENIIEQYRKATEDEVKEFLNKNIPKFKEGDYVVALKSSGFVFVKEGNVYKVTFASYSKVICVDSDNNINTWKPQYFRLATQEEINKHLTPKFEIGDYVIQTNSQILYKVKEVEGKYIAVEGYLYKYLAQYYEKASDDKIKQHLIEQAKKKGFDIGVRVKHVDSIRSFVIEEFKFHPTLKSFPTTAYVSTKNILSVRGTSEIGHLKESEVYDELVIVKDEEIEVNGYKAEYFKNYIKFGCAQISVQMLQDLSLMYKSTGQHRSLNGDIKIGAGTFNEEIIEKLLLVHKNHVFPFN